MSPPPQIIDNTDPFSFSDPVSENVEQAAVPSCAPSPLVTWNTYDYPSQAKSSLQCPPDTPMRTSTCTLSQDTKPCNVSSPIFLDKSLSLPEHTVHDDEAGNGNSSFHGATCSSLSVDNSALSAFLSKKCPVFCSSIELDFIKGQSTSDRNMAKGLIFRICDESELKNSNCTGRSSQKGKSKRAVDFEKLHWVLETTAAFFPVYGTLAKLNQT